MIELNTLIECIEGCTMIELWKDNKCIKFGKAKALALDWLEYKYKSMTAKEDRILITVE